MSAHVQKLSKFSVASAIATASDALVYFIVTQFTSDLPLVLGTVAATAAVVGGIVHFSMARRWVFESDDPVAGQALRYIASSGTGALLHGGIVGLLSLYVGGKFAWLISKAVIYFCWTYPTSAFFVFRSQPNADSL